MGIKIPGFLKYSEKTPKNKTRHVLDVCVALLKSAGVGQHCTRLDLQLKVLNCE